MNRILYTSVLSLVALTLGLSFAHVLEWPAKAAYDAPLYLQLQTSLYAWWGFPGVGGVVEPLAVLGAAVLAVRSRRESGAAALAAAAGLLALAFPVVFLWRVAPANAAFLGLQAGGSPPADWMAWRDRWEVGHAARFALHLAAFALLAHTATRRRRDAD
jgi:Domain of unknown function (DUF1772)